MPGYLVFFITIVTLHEKIVNKMGSIIATVFYVIAMGVRAFQVLCKQKKLI